MEVLRKLIILTETHSVAFSTEMSIHIKHMLAIKPLNTVLNQYALLNGVFQNPVKDVFWSIHMGHFIILFHICLHVFLSELLLCSFCYCVLDVV